MKAGTLRNPAKIFRVPTVVVGGAHQVVPEVEVGSCRVSFLPRRTSETIVNGEQANQRVTKLLCRGKVDVRPEDVLVLHDGRRLRVTGTLPLGQDGRTLELTCSELELLP